MSDMKDLLAGIGSGSGAKIDLLVDALRIAGMQTQVQLISNTQSSVEKVLLQRHLTSLTAQIDVKIPDELMDGLRIAAQQKRLNFRCFPNAIMIPILFTAPHSLHLEREGHKPHMPETFTSRLAKAFAKEQALACLVWTSQEEKRVREMYKMLGIADPSNSDPNFTDCQALSASPWTQKLRQIRSILGPTRRSLHVDLHGCKDPSPNGGSHLVVGLRAMELAGCADVEEFRTNLQKMLAVALQGWSVNVKPLTLLTGARVDGRFTLTQQSLSQAGGAWTHAVQLEMSKSLRQELINNKKMRAVMVKGIVTAWTITASENIQPEFYWKKLVSEGKLLFKECRDRHQSNRIEENTEPIEASIEEVEDASSEEETGNSESTAPPYNVPIDVIEAETLDTFTKMALRCQAVKIALPRAKEVPPIARPVQAVRDWLNHAEFQFDRSLED